MSKQSVDNDNSLPKNFSSESKLIGVWIENYGKIKDQLFQLGSKYELDSSFDLDRQELTIRIADNKNYYELFTNIGVANVTGIIGANGSGKTSFLKLLNVIVAEKPLENKVVLIFESKGRILAYNYVGSTVLFRPNLPDPKKFVVSIVKDGKKYSDSDRKSGLFFNKGSRPFANLNILFYSNHFGSQNDKYLKVGNNLNRSITYQLLESLNYEFISGFVEKEDRDNKDEYTRIARSESFNLLREFHNNKLKKSIKFFADVNTLFPDIKDVIKGVVFPTEMALWFNDDILEEVGIRIRKSSYNFTRLTEINKYCFDLIRETKNTKQRFVNEFIYRLFIVSFVYDSWRVAKGEKLKHHEEFVKDLDLTSNIFEVLKSYLTNLIVKQPKYDLTKIVQILEKLEDLSEGLEFNPPKNIFELSAYEVKLKPAILEIITAILSLNFGGENFFKFNMRPLSSGEEVILNQFAQYYDALHNLESEYVIVSIDEGEAFLHPEWQRTYINNLVKFFNFFNKEFALQKRFHLIVTSHSPFIAGDIPAQNIVFMSRDENGNGIVQASNMQRATFAGNIFELYNDAFFVKGFISAFAEERIKKCVEFLKSNEPNEYFSDIRKVRPFIDMVGESLISEQLYKLLDRRENQNGLNDSGVIQPDTK